MKKTLMIAVATAALSLASLPAAFAQNGLNSSPHAASCMRKAGITYAGWRANNAGTQAQVDKYIACRDRVQAKTR